MYASSVLKMEFFGSRNFMVIYLSALVSLLSVYVSSMPCFFFPHKARMRNQANQRASCLCIISQAKRVDTCETYCLPSLKLTTAHLPPQAHFLAPLSLPPPSVARSSSSLPFGRPTTTSAFTVRKERMRRPEPGPRGPMASGKGVVGSQRACDSSGQLVVLVLACPYVTFKVSLTSPVNLR